MPTTPDLDLLCLLIIYLPVVIVETTAEKDFVVEMSEQQRRCQKIWNKNVVADFVELDFVEKKKVVNSKFGNGPTGLRMRTIHVKNCKDVYL